MILLLQREVQTDPERLIATAHTTGKWQSCGYVPLLTLQLGVLASLNSTQV